MYMTENECRNPAIDLGRIRGKKMPSWANGQHRVDQLLPQAVLDALPVLIAVLDRQGNVLKANMACESFSILNGLVSTYGVVGVEYRKVLEKMCAAQPDALQAAMDGIAAVISGSEPMFQMQHCVVTPIRSHWFTMQVTPVSGLQGQVVVIHQDISQLKAAELASLNMANVDELTGALSRRNFLAVAQQEVERSLRYETPLMVLMLDLDHFKQINDLHCHATGDAVLKHFVATIGAVLRTQDVVGRLGGEEFCVLLPNTTREGGFALARRIVETVANSPVAMGAHVIRYTVSVGATCMHGEATFAELLHLADMALYRAKNEGRNGVAIEPPQ
jgi:diguanylate cyclase (GGDEF)-like protein